MSKKIISLFSGAGGMDIGFEEAGFETAIFVELDPSCCDTLRLNRPHIPIINNDITNVKTEDILKAANLKPLEAAAVIGGPPCQSFSLAGKRMGMNDPRGKLVLEFIRVVRESLPKFFVMENVKGMISWEKGRALEAILEEISQPIIYDSKEYKYNVTYKVLNAVDYGVSQQRERVFIVGNRIGKIFNYPEATHGDSEKYDLFSQLNPYKNVWDAIGDLPPAEKPSDMAIRISQTIKDRIAKHGY